MSNPKTHSGDELNGASIDMATEAAAFFRNRADKYPRGSREAEAFLEWSDMMKDYGAGLRGKPLF